VLDDGTFYRARIPHRTFDDFKDDWENFLMLESQAREAIVAALLEERESRRNMMLRYFDQNFEEYLAERNSNVQTDSVEPNNSTLENRSWLDAYVASRVIHPNKSENP